LKLLSDIDLIQAIVDGSNEAFKELYTRFSTKVYNTALSYTKNTDEADDVTQEVFVKIFRSAAKFKGNSELSTWVYRIVVNTSLNHLKKKNRFILFKDTSKPTESIDFVHPGVVLENKENAQILYKVLELLPNTQKTAFILSYIEELPRQEVADIMETSLKAVESLLQRAKTNLKKHLEKLYPHRRK